MRVAEVERLLKLQEIDTSRGLTVLHNRPAGDAWAGFFTVEFRDGNVSRVLFCRGNLNIIEGAWILSQK